MFEGLLEGFSYGFMQKALFGGIIIGITSSLLGTFLILKNYSLIGDGLAHVNFAAISIALLFSFDKTFFSIIFTGIFAIIIKLLTNYFKEKGDMIIAITSSFSMALGIIITSINNGFNIDITSFLFGSILQITLKDIIISSILLFIILTFIFLNKNSLISYLYDINFSKVIGINSELLDIILVLLTAMTVSIGIRVVGTLLISSLIVFPSAAAINVTRSFNRLIGYSVLFSIINVSLGVILSYIFNIPSGGSIVVISTVIFAISLLKRRK